uniref:Uncharacterized protein n=1 Tax=Leersia perrieri TaxID=77586 RepID=A0A0D9W595_9ORYZ
MEWRNGCGEGHTCRLCRSRCCKVETNSESEGNGGNATRREGKGEEVASRLRLACRRRKQSRAVVAAPPVAGRRREEDIRQLLSSSNGGGKGDGSGCGGEANENLNDGCRRGYRLDPPCPLLPLLPTDGRDWGAHGKAARVEELGGVTTTSLGWEA